MEREKKLASNLLLFAVGNIGSKLLQFLLVPFYTAVLNPDQYGITDILQTGSSLIIPIFSLTIAESVFRYGMEKSEDKKAVFSIGINVVTVGSVLIIILGVVTQPFWPVVDSFMIWLMLFYSIANMYRNITSQFLRAIGKVKLFTIDNVIQTLSILILNILLLVQFQMGVSGYMLGYILGNLISFVFGLFAGSLWKFFSLSQMSKKMFFEMLRFSIPLIPNTICWWISSSTDRLMIIAWIGTAANGLYSVAHKIPSVLSVVVNIFVQAWQISANEEFGQKGSSEFYSEIFEVLSAFCFVGASLMILCSRIEIRLITNSEYYDAWPIMSALIMGMTFFSFAQFLGTIYTANKKTAMAFITNLIAAVVNVVLNIFMIGRYGAVGAAIATSISYFVLWITRIITTDKIIHLKIKWLSVGFSSVLIVLMTIVQLMEIRGDLFLEIICFFAIIIFNYKTVLKIAKATVRLLGEKIKYGKKF